jgi:hypothetical protein
LAGAGAPVQVVTADGEPMTQANFLGMYSMSGIKPLLPGLFGGIGLHTAVVDIPGYELERENVLFPRATRQRISSSGRPP